MALTFKRLPSSEHVEKYSVLRDEEEPIGVIGKFQLHGKTMIQMDSLSNVYYDHELKALADFVSKLRRSG